MAEGREKRERKAPVATYQVVSPTKKAFVIPEGKGVKLRDIPNGAPPVCHVFLFCPPPLYSSG